MERPLLRRLITVPLVVLGAIVAVVLLPLSLLAAAVVDRGRPWQRMRLVVLITGGLVIEVLGIVGAFVIWVGTGFGLLRTKRWTWQPHRILMGVYTAVLLRFIAWVLGTHIEWRSRHLPLDGPIVLLARHTSFFDALIPATVLGRHNQRVPHHVLTAGLRYMPCIDIVGDRFPNRFIRRTPGDGSIELGEIERLGTVVDEHSGAIIFPEGTFRDPSRFERAVRRLRRRNPELADQAETFDHVLPPRPQGTHALLAGAATADVLVCANTGLEPFSTLEEIRTSLVAQRPIIVETWIVPRDEIPDEPEAFNRWLMDEYGRIDRWVSDRLAE